MERHSNADNRAGFLYLLLGKQGERIAGNLLAWPDDNDVPLDGRVHRGWIDAELIPGDLYS